MRSLWLHELVGEPIADSSLLFQVLPANCIADTLRSTIQKEAVNLKDEVKQTLPAVRPKRVIRALEHAGFVVHHVSGSHYIMKHPAKPSLRVTVPFHNRDLKRGTLQSIVKQSGFTNEKLTTASVAAHCFGA